MVALVLTLLAASVEQRPTFVSVRAPDACPGRERYEAELTFRSERILIVPDATTATATVTLTIVSSRRRYEGEVLVTANGRAVTRKVAGPRCESVVAALSLAAALVLDPEARAGAVPAALPPPPVPPPPPPVEPPAPEPAPIAVAVEPAPPVQLAGPSPSSEVPAAAGALRLAAHGGFELSSTITGAIDPSGSLAASLLIGTSTLRVSSRLVASAGAGRTVSASTGTVLYGAQVSGQLEAGAALVFGRFRPELAVGLRVLSVTLQGQGADEVLSSTRWLAELGPRARLTITFGSLELAVAGGVAASLTRERYLFIPQGVVFAVPPWAGWGQVTVGWSFLG